MTTYSPAINPIPRELLVPPKPDVIDYKVQAFVSPSRKERTSANEGRPRADDLCPCLDCSSVGGAWNEEGGSDW
jgi:hypothetical protein